MIEFKITEESIIKINKIVNEMEGGSFHNHYHIIYDIISSIDSDKVKYMEIGSYAGASVSLMSSHPKVTKSYSLDIGTPISKEIPIKNVNHFKNKNLLGAKSGGVDKVSVPNLTIFQMVPWTTDGGRNKIRLGLSGKDQKTESLTGFSININLNIMKINKMI